jgi:DNA/RNA-binding domain of Phe-tRNA-synthetase-like protein
MWFILESLGAMPIEALHEARDRLVAGLGEMSPGAKIEARIISAS